VKWLKKDIYKKLFGREVTIQRGAHNAKGYCQLSTPKDWPHLIWCVYFDETPRYSYEWKNKYIKEKNEIQEKYTKNPQLSVKDFKSYRLVIK
jgi:hypothetical protein